MPVGTRARLGMLHGVVRSDHRMQCVLVYLFQKLSVYYARAIYCRSTSLRSKVPWTWQEMA